MNKKTAKAVRDGKLDYEQYGLLGRRFDDIRRRCDQGTLELASVLPSLQAIAEGHRIVEELPRKVRNRASYVDLDADPFCPKWWKATNHRKGGGLQKVERRGDDLYVGGQKIVLFRSERQMGGKTIEGFELKKEWDKQPIFNANLLDFLYKEENRHLIPESWKGLLVFFPGTEYSASGGDLSVRYLYWGGNMWRWDCRWLSSRWDESLPAASLASPFVT